MLVALLLPLAPALGQEAGSGGSASPAPAAAAAPGTTSEASSATTTEPAAGEETAASTAAVESSAATTAAAAATTTVPTPDQENEVVVPRPPETNPAPFNGSYTKSIEIDVPDFHEIEPALKLVYDSNAGARAGGHDAGFVGVGWRLDGVPDVVRTTQRGGAPKFDSTDRYILNGVEITACTGGSTSPSCAAGGTHEARYERYERIGYDSSANKWTVWSKSGTRSVFEPVSKWQTPVDTNVPVAVRDTYRWRLSQVIDTHGNTVTYTYQCTTLPACWPKTISYNGALVEFFVETNPEPLTGATGLTLAKFDKRLRSIKVSHGGSLARAYTFTYDQSPATSLSRLTAVRQYGTDTVIDSAGTVSGGTALPPYLLEYSGSATNFETISYFSGLGAAGGHQYYDNGNLNVSYYTNNQDQNSTYCSLLNVTFGCTWDATNVIPLITDLTGDGKVDLLLTFFAQNGCDNCGYVANLVKGPGLSSTCTMPTYGTPPDAKFSAKYLVMDYNGDGAADFVSDDDTITCNGAALPADLKNARSAMGIAKSTRKVALDVNGDGIGDVAYFDRTNSGDTLRIRTLIGTGSGWVSGATSTFAISGNISIGILDLNGDGKTDLVISKGSTARALLSTGAGFVNVTDLNWTYAGDGKVNCPAGVLGWNSSYPPPNRDFGLDAPGDTTIHMSCGEAADINGDGRDDLLAMTEDGPIALITRAAGFESTALGNGPYFWLFDTRGDGRFGPTKPDNHKRLTGAFPDLMTKITVPFGATTSLEYKPSSQWTNIRLPRVMHAVTKTTDNDGRGTTAPTKYAYLNGYYDAVERRFLGFKNVTATLPCIGTETNCPTREYTFRQDRASAGQVEQLDYRDENNTLFRRDTETWSVTTAPPYRALNTASEQKHYD